MEAGEMRKGKMGNGDCGIRNGGLSAFRIPNSAFRIREDYRTPRDWLRPWRDPPGFFLPNCPCCGATSSLSYHTIGGLTAGSPSVRRNTNYQYTIDAHTTKATLDKPIDSMAGCTPTGGGPCYKYGGVCGFTVLASAG